MTFRTRMTLLSGAALALAIALASAVVYLVVRSELRARVDDSLYEALDAVRSGPEQAQSGFVLVARDTAIGGVRFSAQVVTEDGAATEPGPLKLPVSEETRRVADGSAPAYLSDATVDGQHVRILTAPLGAGLAVEIGRSLEEVDSMLERLRILLLVTFLGGIVVASGLGYAVARAALRPVARLTDLAEEVAETRDLSRRIDASPRDELGRLAASINTMMGALERSMEAQRRLVADVSHELRTPLTSVRANVQYLRSGRPLEPSERERLLGDLDAEVEELVGLVGAILDMARAEEQPVVDEPVRLDELASWLVDRTREQAPEALFELDLEPSEIQGDRRRIEWALRNLLENAVEWAPAGTAIDVTVRGAEVTVRDRGFGIPAAEAERVFDRFYRAPAARSLPGSGLGLAIVRQVAEAHGGEAWVEVAEGGGACFRLRLSGTS